MIGRIVKGVGGFFDVLTDRGIITCKARGHFRKDLLSPMIGDMVEIIPQSDGLAVIERLLPRRNELLRPTVANIDQLVIVVSASLPRPDWLLVDKLLLQCSLLNIRPLLALNKLDELMHDTLDQFDSDYAGTFPALRLSSKTGEGMDTLCNALSTSVSCFAGQSAVGKSSLLNALLPQLSLEVGALSHKTEHGRHTTRHAQLCPFMGGAVVDTPGFSLMETQALSQAQLDAAYPEFGNAPTYCRFADCSHISEPSCAVKSLLNEKRLPAGRYERYMEIHREVERINRSRYD